MDTTHQRRYGAATSLKYDHLLAFKIRDTRSRLDSLFLAWKPDCRSKACQKLRFAWPTISSARAEPSAERFDSDFTLLPRTSKATSPPLTSTYHTFFVVRREALRVGHLVCLRQAFFDLKTSWAMLEVEPIDIEGRRVRDLHDQH